MKNLIIVLITIIWFNFINAQNFLQLFSPFLSSGLGALGKSNPGSNNNQISNAVSAAQTIISTFTNSENNPGSNNLFNSFLNIPIGSALSPPQSNLKTDELSRSILKNSQNYQNNNNVNKLYTIIPQTTTLTSPKNVQSEPITPNSPPDIFTLLEPFAKATRKRVEARRKQSYPRQSNVPNSPIGRVTNNFGNNFFKMLAELQEYSSLAKPESEQFNKNSQSSLSQAENNENYLINDDIKSKAIDMIDANNILKAFFRKMSKDVSQPLRPLPAFNDGTETGRNRPLIDQLFESDILLTSRQIKAIVLAEAEKNSSFHRRVKRKVITGGVYRWSKSAPIPYSFSVSDEKWRDVIRSGLKLWEKETCIRFRENGFGKDRIEFFRGGGCYSSVGRVGGTQKISIGYGCDDRGIVSHEVGHALGFWHEQSRPDRDKYIHLEEDYIAGGTNGNFAKRSDLEIDGMGLPYDLGSVMHYGPNAFTIDWDHTTIVTLDKKYQHTIGQRLKPSFIDVKQINRLYCFNTCFGTTVQCVNGGYADPNNCQKCKCPPGLGGLSCENVERSDGLCGGELFATTVWQHLTYKGRSKCNWIIKAKEARIRFILDFAHYQCDTTCRSYVEIKHNSDFQQSGFRSCCEEKNLEVTSDQDEVIVISHMHKNHNFDGSFSLRYIQDSGAPLPRPPPPHWIPGYENRAFRGIKGKGGVIEKFILNAIPKVRDPNRPVESVFSILTDYFASSILGTSRD